MAYTYAQLVSAIANTMATVSTGVNFQAELPSMIDYAEQRIQRDLDLISTVTTNATQTLTAANRNFTVPTGFRVVQDMNVITPISAASADTGTRNQLVPCSKEYLNATWNSVSGASIPQYFAMISDSTLIVGPWPDQPYKVEILGTVFVTPLYTQTDGNWLSINLPDLYFAACMIFMSGYMRNFGSQADDPKMAMSWETQYQVLMKSANDEDARRKFAASAWTSLSTPIEATASR